MGISSIFELYSLSTSKISELLGENAGEIRSVNIVAHKLPEEGKRVLWVSRTCEIEVGTYVAKYDRVDLLFHLGFGEDSLLRSPSSFHFWIDVENPEAFSYSFRKIKTSVMNHADPVVSQVQDVFFDMFGRMMQYLGPYNQPPENRKVLLLDYESAYHLGYYHCHVGKPATVSLCDTDLIYPASNFAMWSDLQLEGLEHLLKLAIIRPQAN